MAYFFNSPTCGGMAIDAAGNLWIPVPQLNRTVGFQKGVETVDFPVKLFKMPIAAQPFRD